MSILSLLGMSRAEAQIAEPIPASFKNGAVSVHCGDVMSGSFVGAQNDHNGYMARSGSMSGWPYIMKERPERSYAFTLGAPAYVLIDQLGYTRHGVVLCEDNSNGTDYPFGEYALHLQLGAGTYFINIEQGEDTSELDYSFRLLCSPAPLLAQMYPSIKQLAQQVSSNQVVRGDFSRGSNHLSHYRDFEWPRYWDYSFLYPFRNLRDFYRPERDTFYTFRLQERRQVSIRNNANTGHKAYLMDSAGYAYQLLDVNITKQEEAMQASSTLSLPAGTYYLAIEQASATTAEPYEFQISSTCTPEVPALVAYGYDPYGSEMLDVNLNQGKVRGVVHLQGYREGYFYNDLFATVGGTMYLGWRENTLTINSAPGYVRMFADLNFDGDFEDGYETIYQNIRKGKFPSDFYGNYYFTENLLRDHFKLDFPDSLANRVEGRVVRMRVIVSDTNVTAPCGRYTDKDRILDFAARIDRPAGEPASTSWVRQQADNRDDETQYVRSGPAGSVYAVSYHPMPGADVSYLTAYNQVNIQGETGKGVILEKGQRHHDYLGGIGSLTRYRADGSLAWTRAIIPTPVNTNPGYYSLTNCWTDAQGGVYLSGTAYGGIGISNDSGTRGLQVHMGSSDRVYAFICRIDSTGGGDSWAIGGSSYYINGKDGASDSRGNTYWSGTFNNNGWPVPPPPFQLGTLVMPYSGKQGGFIAKRAATGAYQWAVHADGEGAVTAPLITATSSGAVILAGIADSALTLRASTGDTVRVQPVGTQTYLARFDSAGRLSWTYLLPSTSVRVSKLAPIRGAEDVLLAGMYAGTLVLGGTTWVNMGGEDAFLARMRPDGSFVWLKRLAGADMDRLFDVNADSRDSIQVVANISPNTMDLLGTTPPLVLPGQQQVVITVDPATGLAKVVFGRYSAPSSMVVRSVARANGGVFIGGSLVDSSYFEGFGTINTEGRVGYPLSKGWDGFVARLGGGDRLVPTVPTSTKSAESLSKSDLIVYPNPAHGSLSVRLEGLSPGTHPLRVLDMTGRIVLQLMPTDEALKKGVQMEAVLPVGLYEIRVAGKSCRVVVE